MDQIPPNYAIVAVALVFVARFAFNARRFWREGNRNRATLDGLLAVAMIGFAVYAAFQPIPKPM